MSSTQAQAVLQAKLQKWIEYDNEQHELNEKMNALRAKKKELSDEIFKITETNGMKEARIKMNNEKIHITMTNVQQPLTFKYLQNTLSDIIKDESQLGQTMKYIKEKREVKVVQEIKRIMPK
jgi:seryl-tRNA synthetase